MLAPSYSLRLGQSTLIFFPPQYPDATSESPSTEAQVAQVRIALRESSKACINLFYRVEKDITAAIESILHAHMTSPLPRRLTVEGDGYTLHGERSLWTYGQTDVKFLWGERYLKASNDKWSFILDPATRSVE